MADDFLQRAHQFFISKGYPPHAAAALAANAVAESGGNTRAVHDQGTGVGIYGFRDPTAGAGRKTALFNFAKERDIDPYAESTQLEYAAHELDTSEKKAGDALKGSKDYREAQVAAIGYLRPHFYNPDPSKQTIPADRWNPGATVAGVQPMLGETVAAAGSADTPAAPTAPTTGLLAGQLDTTKLDQLRAEQAALAAGQAEKKKSDEQDQALAELQKTGLGLLAEGQKIQPGPQFLAPPPPLAAAEAPDYDFLAPPTAEPLDFQKMLAQQRLRRGMV